MWCRGAVICWNWSNIEWQTGTCTLAGHIGYIIRAKLLELNFFVRKMFKPARQIFLTADQFALFPALNESPVPFLPCLHVVYTPWIPPTPPPPLHLRLPLRHGLCLNSSILLCCCSGLHCIVNCYILWCTSLEHKTRQWTSPQEIYLCMLRRWASCVHF